MDRFVEIFSLASFFKLPADRIESLPPFCVSWVVFRRECEGIFSVQTLLEESLPVGG
jgi:hypothetical protein